MADDQEEKGKRRPRDSDPGRGDFLECENGDEKSAGPSVNCGEEARELGIARSGEIGAVVEKHGHQREGEEADSEVMPFLRCIHIYDNGADESCQDNRVGVKAEITTVGVDSENRKKSGEDAPPDCNPERITLAVDEGKGKDSGSSGVQLRSVDGIFELLWAEPSCANVEQRDDEEKGDEAERNAGSQKERGIEVIHNEGAKNRGERENVSLVRQVAGRKHAGENEKKKCSGNPDNGGPGI